MPRAGSQVPICDYPIRFDTYRGCINSCFYCFTRRKQDDKIGLEAQVDNDEGPTALRNFIEGERKHELAWCDWSIPLHIGGMSDPFQEIDRERRRTYDCLKILAETQYPFIISTKCALPADPEYLKLISKCNVCFQFSLVSPEYDKLEPGAPPFYERLKTIKKVAEVVPRMIIRIQPYRIEQLDSVLNITLPEVKKAGVHGTVVEGFKAFKGKLPGMEQIGGDMCYPAYLLEDHYTQIRNRSKDLGLAFFCGENRLRWMGDSLGCCGCDDMVGFVGNKYNLNHIYNGENPQPTAKMKELGTTACFKTLIQTAWSGDVLDQIPFDVVMRHIAQSEYGYTTMGLDTGSRDNTFKLGM